VNPWFSLPEVTSSYRHVFRAFKVCAFWLVVGCYAAKTGENTQINIKKYHVLHGSSKDSIENKRLPLDTAISYELASTEFTQKEKIALSAFPDEVIRKALARYHSVRPKIREPIKYVFKLCWDIANKSGLYPDWVWKNKLLSMEDTMFQEPFPLKSYIGKDKSGDWIRKKETPPLPVAPPADPADKYAKFPPELRERLHAADAKRAAMAAKPTITVVKKPEPVREPVVIKSSEPVDTDINAFTPTLFKGWSMPKTQYERNQESLAQLYKEMDIARARERKNEA
jgi:hypothetical protein